MGFCFLFVKFFMHFPHCMPTVKYATSTCVISLLVSAIFWIEMRFSQFLHNYLNFPSTIRMYIQTAKWIVLVYYERMMELIFYKPLSFHNAFLALSILLCEMWGWRTWEISPCWGIKLSTIVIYALNITIYLTHFE